MQGCSEIQISRSNQHTPTGRHSISCVYHPNVRAGFDSLFGITEPKAMVHFSRVDPVAISHTAARSALRCEILPATYPFCAALCHAHILPVDSGVRAVGYRMPGLIRWRSSDDETRQAGMWRVGVCGAPKGGSIVTAARASVGGTKLDISAADRKDKGGANLRCCLARPGKPQDTPRYLVLSGTPESGITAEIKGYPVRKTLRKRGTP